MPDTAAKRPRLADPGPADLGQVVERLDRIAGLLKRIAERQPGAAVAPAGGYLNAGQVAELVGCSERSVWTWSADGRLPRPVRLGKNMRWERRAIEEHLRRQQGKRR